MPHAHAQAPQRSRTRDLVGVVAGGAFMGAAEIVPGVSGGTIALVFGIYDRLIDALSTGSSALGCLLTADVKGAVERLRGIDWPFLAGLLAGMGAAILALTSVLEHLLDTRAVTMSALFFGLVLGSVFLAARELHEPLSGSRLAVTVVVAIVTFVGLGLTAGRVDDPTLVAYFAAAAIAICAMILPGISGSFLLLLMGMYQPVISAVNERDLVVLAVFALGAAVGLGLFSAALNVVLDRHHDLTLAALVGLMAGSLRVLWPWPAGVDGVADAGLGAPVAGDVPMAALAAVAGLAVVLVIARIGDVTVGDDVDVVARADQTPEEHP